MQIHFPSPAAHPVRWAWPALVRSVSIAIVVSLALLVGRGHPLQNLNEGLYARVAQEMLERRDFVVPTLDGVPYLEKPPLLYWLTDAAVAIFGPGEPFMRLAPLLGAVLAVSGAAWFAHRHLEPSSAALVGPILASAPIVFVLSRTLMFDLLFAGLLFVALVLLYEAIATQRKAPLRWSYALLALAILAKGLAAAVFYGIVAVALLLSSRRGTRRLSARAFVDPLALALLLATALPWHALAVAEQPGFLWFYLVNEHVLRFFGGRLPQDYHTGPWWYYLPRLAAYLFPWIILLLLPAQRASLSPDARTARRFLWIALIAPLAIFSVSDSKADYYMVVGAVPLALLIADRLARAHSIRFALASLGAAWIAVLLAVAWGLRDHVAPYALPASFLADVTVAAMLAVGVLVMAFVGSRSAAVVACAAIAVPCAALYSDFFDLNEAAKSARSLASSLQASATPVYVYRNFESVSALAFYLDSSVGVVDYRGGDLTYGLQLAPQVDRFTGADALRQRAQTEPLWLIVPKPERERFAASALARVFTPTAEVGGSQAYASRPLAETLARQGRLAARTLSEGAAVAVR